MVRAGRLRHRITIMGTMEKPDGHHGTLVTPVPIATRIPADVSALTGRTLERARQIEPRSTHGIDLRFRKDVRTGQTIVFHDPDLGDRELEVIVPPISVGERRQLLQLLCKENERARASEQAPSESTT